MPGSEVTNSWPIIASMIGNIVLVYKCKQAKYHLPENTNPSTRSEASIITVDKIVYGWPKDGPFLEIGSFHATASGDCLGIVVTQICQT